MMIKPFSDAIMDADDYSYREEMLDLRQKLLEAEEQRLNGAKTYSLEEANSCLDKFISAESAIQ
ncbi:MAG: hypothetical protein ACI4J6_03190 [Oscillospiraceae bacterium]